MDKHHWNNEGMSGMKKLAHKHLWEGLSAIAIIVALLSAWGHFFWGTMNWSLILMAVGSIVAIFLPWQIDRGIKQIHSWGHGRNKAWGLIIEGIKIAVALFIPFIYFAWLGMMAGTAIHYYIQHTYNGEDRGSKAA